VSRRVGTAWFAVLACVAAAGAQEPGEREAGERAPGERGQQPAPMSAVERERAMALLRRHATRSVAVDVLVAGYVQRRTTELSATPLVSEGSFLFVREPACVVFRAQQPRVSVVRLSASCYEVYRPERRQLERFLLGGPELAEGLFAAVGGDAERLLRDFELAGCEPAAPGRDEAVASGRDEAAALRLRLLPKAEAAKKRLTELLLTLREGDAALAAVAYRDAAGDLVEIELRDLRVNPEQPPAATLDVPEGTRVLEHAPVEAGKEDEPRKQDEPRENGQPREQSP
jgi:hypothetical protein